MPTPVDDLQARRDAEFPVSPGTNEEEALRFLALNPEHGWAPKEVASQTGVARSSVNKTLARLYEKDLVDRVEGLYFVKPARVDEVRGLLGDMHSLTQLASEPTTQPVHPRDATRETAASYEPSTDEEVETLVDDVLE